MCLQRLHRQYSKDWLQKLEGLSEENFEFYRVQEFQGEVSLVGRTMCTRNSLGRKAVLAINQALGTLIQG